MDINISVSKLVVLASALSIGISPAAFAQEGRSATIQLANVSADLIAQSSEDIVDVAVSEDDFSTLVAAIQAADLVDALQGEGPFTVFAPTNEAFAALPDGVVDALLLPENKDLLTEVLTYHVVSGEVMSSDLSTGPVETLNGDEVMVSVAPDMVMVNDVDVITADISASNGVIHVIDEVLVPTTTAVELESRMAMTQVEEETTTTAVEEETTTTAVEEETTAEPVRALW